MKYSTLFIYIVAILALLSCLAFAQECDEHSTIPVITGFSQRFLYGFLPTKVEITGCNLQLDGYTTRNIGYADTPCIIDDEHSTSTLITCTTTANKNLHGAQVLTYIQHNPTTSDEIIATWNKSLFVHNPWFEHATPFSAANLPGLEIRLALHDLPISAKVSVKINDIDMIITTRGTDHLIFSLPDTLVLDTQPILTVTDTMINTPVLTVIRPVNFFTPEEGAPAITSTSPQWIPAIIEKPIPFTVNGIGLSNVEYLVLYTPITFEPVTLPVDPETRSESSVSFSIDHTAWTTLDTQGTMITMFELLDNESKLIASSELSLVLSPQYRFTTPSNDMPANFAGTWMTMFFQQFPRFVPCRIHWAGIEIISNEAGQHPFVPTQNGVSFALPPCDDTTGCKAPHTGPVCLVAEDSDLCLSTASDFTYTEVDKDAKKLVRSFPNESFLDYRDAYFTLYFYGYNINDVKDTLRLVSQTDTPTTIVPVLLESGATWIQFSLPKDAYKPGTYPEGIYTPQVHIPTTQGGLTAPPSIEIKLTFDNSPSVSVVLTTNELYNVDNNTTLYNHLVELFTTQYSPKQNTLLFLNIIKSPYDNTKAALHFIITPSHSTSTASSSEYSQMLQEAVKDKNSPFHTLFPQIPSTDLKEHKFTTVKYCSNKNKYLIDCDHDDDGSESDDDDKKDNKMFIYIVIGVLGLIAIICVIAALVSRSSRKNKHDDDSSLLRQGVNGSYGTVE